MLPQSDSGGAETSKMASLICPATRLGWGETLGQVSPHSCSLGASLCPCDHFTKGLQLGSRTCYMFAQGSKIH